MFELCRLKEGLWTFWAVKWSYSRVNLFMASQSRRSWKWLFAIWIWTYIWLFSCVHSCVIHQSFVILVSFVTVNARIWSWLWMSCVLVFCKGSIQGKRFSTGLAFKESFLCVYKFVLSKITLVSETFSTKKADAWSFTRVDNLMVLQVGSKLKWLFTNWAGKFIFCFKLHVDFVMALQIAIC